MLKLIEDKKKSMGEIDFHYFLNFICYKWYENKSASLLITIFDRMSNERSKHNDKI